MPITPRTFPTIVADLRQKMTTSLPTLDTSEGTFFRLAGVDPFSLEAEELEALLLSVQESQSLLTARGVDLDLLAFNYNVFRRGSQKASGFVQFYIPTASLTDPITIPVGTVVTSQAGVTYTTLLEGVLNGFAQETTRNAVAVYEITIPVIASISGSAGNSDSGLLTESSITTLSVTNDSIILGGYEEEPDDSLASRAIASFGVWSRGIESAVEYGVRTVSGVYYCSAVYSYAGHFTVYVSDQAGNLSDELKAAVDAILPEWAAAGIGWTILQPPLFLQNVTLKVLLKSSANEATQVAQIQTDVSSVINASDTNTIYFDDFVVDLKTKLNSYVLHFDLDTPTDHIIKDTGTIIRSGTITVIVQ